DMQVSIHSLRSQLSKAGIDSIYVPISDKLCPNVPVEEGENVKFSQVSHHFEGARAHIQKTILEPYQNRKLIFGLSVFEKQYAYSLVLTKLIRELCGSSLIFIGGPQCCSDIGNVIKHFTLWGDANVLINGEAEEIIAYLVEELIDVDVAQPLDRQLQASLSERIKGVYIHTGGKGVDFESSYANRVENLDDLHFDVAIALENESIYINISRGCPFKCTYCIRAGGSLVRHMSARRILQILSDIRVVADRPEQIPIRFTTEDVFLHPELHKIIHIWRFNDFNDTFLCDNVFGNVRTAKVWLARHGQRIADFASVVTSIEFGFESACNRQLGLWQTGITWEESLEVIEQLDAAGIAILGDFIAAGKDTRSIDFIEHCINIIAALLQYEHFLFNNMFSFIIPYHGTDEYDRLAFPGDQVLYYRVYPLRHSPHFNNFCLFGAQLPKDEVLKETVLRQRLKILEHSISGDCYDSRRVVMFYFDLLVILINNMYAAGYQMDEVQQLWEKRRRELARLVETSQILLWFDRPTLQKHITIMHRSLSSLDFFSEMDSATGRKRKRLIGAEPTLEREAVAGEDQYVAVSRNFGDSLRKLRHPRGCSTIPQREVARAAGKSSDWVGVLESGVQKSIHPYDLVAVAEFLGAEVVSLVDGVSLRAVKEKPDARNGGPSVSFAVSAALDPLLYRKFMLLGAIIVTLFILGGILFGGSTPTLAPMLPIGEVGGQPPFDFPGIEGPASLLALCGLGGGIGVDEVVRKIQDMIPQTRRPEVTAAVAKKILQIFGREGKVNQALKEVRKILVSLGMP
ncbi:radical SAM protein, partial [Candidatus Omnitrophota bacterium]